MKKIFLLFAMAAACLVLGVKQVEAYSLSNPAPGFGSAQYNNLISDELFTAFGMSDDEVVSFLNLKGSWLKNYSIPEYQTVPFCTKDGNGNIQWSSVSVRQFNDSNSEPYYGMLAGHLIAQRGHARQINPQVMLVTLEKESSSITRSTPLSATNEVWMLGVGWDDTMAVCGYSFEAARQRAIDYGGVGLQIAYGMNTLRNRYNSYQSSYATPFTTGDGAIINAANAATRALYAYTPYVYNGNYNFWKLMNTWFSPVPPYNPTLAKGDDGTVYVVDDNGRWPVTGAGFVHWGFSWNSVTNLTVEQAALPVKSLITKLARDDDGTVYYLDRGYKRVITSPRVFDRYNLSWHDVSWVSNVILAKIPWGLPMYELVRLNGDDGTVYLATNSLLYPVSGDAFYNGWTFKEREIGFIPGHVTSSLTKGGVLGRFATPIGGDTIFLLDRGYGYKLSGAVARAWNFDLAQNRIVGIPVLDERAAGGLLTVLAQQAGGDGTIYLVENGKKRPITGAAWSRNGYKGSDVRVLSAALLNTLPTGDILR